MVLLRPGLDEEHLRKVFGQAGYIRTTYSYTPYGSVTEEGDVTQPLQWSSEFNDTELGLIYYNYRYYNALDGSWLRRDPDEEFSANLYGYVSNHPAYAVDVLGRNENCSSYTDEEYADCVDVSVTIKVRKWLFFYTTKVWQPGKETAVHLTDTFYQFPYMALRAKWKNTTPCKCAKKCFDRSKKTISYQINFYRKNGTMQRYSNVNKLPSYTLYGSPSDLELSWAHGLGWNGIGIGLVHIGISSRTEYLRLEVKVSSYVYAISDYYL